MRDNIHYAGRGISIGSEVSGGVEDVFVSNVHHIGPSEHGLHIKTAASRGGYVRNVTYEKVVLGNITGDSIISLTTSYGGGGGTASPLTQISNVSYSNISVHSPSAKGAGSWKCFKDMPCQNFALNDVQLSPIQGWTCEHLVDSKAENVSPSGLTDCFRHSL